jgi:pyrimidine nucleoside transport protein
MAPSRKRDMAKLALRTLFAANIACFMTASIAGMFRISSYLFKGGEGRGREGLTSLWT